MTSIVTRLAAGGTWFAGALFLLPACGGGGLSEADREILSALKAETEQNRAELASLRELVGRSGAVGTLVDEKHQALLAQFGTFSDGIYGRLEATKAAVQGVGRDAGTQEAVAALQTAVQGFGERIAALESSLTAHAGATAEKLAAHGSLGAEVQTKLQALEGAQATLAGSLRSGFDQTNQAFQAEARKFETALRDLETRLAAVATAQGQIQKDVETREKNLRTAIDAAQVASAQAVQNAQKVAKDTLDALDARVMAKLNEIFEAVKTGEGALLTRFEAQSREIGRSATGIEGLFASVERTLVERFGALQTQMEDLRVLATNDAKVREQALGKLGETAVQVTALDQRHAQAAQQLASIAQDLAAVRTLLTPSPAPSEPARSEETPAKSENG